MALKKRKRFNEGGLSDKDAGLEASKDDKVGFFERLRMGNIDQEGSEAYNRFGAGRGRASRVPVEDRAPTPVTRPSTPTSTPVPEMDPMEAANAREPISMPAGPRADMPKPGGRRNVDVQVSKPSAPAKSAPTKTSAYPMTGAQPTTKTYSRTGGPTADELANYRNTRSLASQIPDTGNPSSPTKGEKVEPMSDSERNLQNILMGAGGVGGAAGAIYKGKKMLDARKAAQAGAKKRANLKRDVEEGIDRNLADEFKSYSQSAAEKAVAAKQGAEKTKADRSRDLIAGQAKTKFTSTSKTPPKKTKKFDDESNVEFKRGGKAYASGGSVSGASKRGDGIATRGKTNCKMR